MSGETVLATERLDLRLWPVSEVETLLAIISDPVTMHAWPAPLERHIADIWIERSATSYAADRTGRFALIRRSDGVAIGDAGLVRAHAAGRDILDLGYIVHHPYWRQGYGYEAASALMRYALETLGEPEVHAHMAIDNPASVAVAEKLAMTRVEEFPFERNRGKTHRLYVMRRSTA